MNYFILSDGSVINLNNVTNIYLNNRNSEYKYQVDYNNDQYSFITEFDYNKIIASLKYRNLVVNE